MIAICYWYLNTIVLQYIINIITIFCNNDVCVAAAVFKDVLNGAFNGRDALNGALQAAILCFQ